MVRPSRSVRGARPSGRPAIVLVAAALAVGALAGSGALAPAPAGAATGTDTGSVQGQVTHAGAPLSGILVTLMNPAGATVRFTRTSPGGAYSITGVVPGTYRLAFADTTKTYPAGAFWPDQPDLADAGPVDVVAGTAFVADQQLWTAADQPIPPLTGSPVGPTVAVIGDSITQKATHGLHAALDPIASSSVLGILGQRVDAMQPVAERMVPMAPHHVIINLGANDALQQHDLTQTEAALATMLATFPSAACLSVVTITEETAYGAFNDYAHAYNAFIRGLPATDPRVMIIDYQALVRDHVETGAPPKWTDDGIHLTAAGIAVYGAMVADAVRLCDAGPSSISGSVFEDTDGSGIQDVGEPALGGVGVTASGTDVLGRHVEASASSAADGSFTVTPLRPGTYRITEAAPDRYGTPTITVGSAGGSASGAMVDGVVLGLADHAGGYVFAQAPPASVIGGSVFADLDRDGSRQAGEPGVAAVVRLTGTDAGGHAVDQTTGTDATGSWSFSGIRPGTYDVTEQPPNGFFAGAVVAGPAGGTPTTRGLQGIVVDVGIDAPENTFAERPATVGSWATTMTATSPFLTKTVAASPGGGAVVAGSFTGDANLGSVGGPPASVATGGQRAVVVAGYGASGVLSWWTTIAGPGYAEVARVATDGTGNSYVVGTFNGAVTFGAGATAETLSGTADGYVASFDPTGSPRWVRVVEAAGSQLTTSVAVDAAGVVLVTGVDIGGVVVGAESPAPVTLGAVGVLDGYVATYALDGAFVDARVVQGGPGSVVVPIDVAGDGAGGSIVGGAFAGVPGGAGGLDGFVMATDATGATAWFRSFGGAGTDAVLGIDRDPGTGRVVAVGTFEATATFDVAATLSSAGSSDGFVVSIDPDGTTAWARQVAGARADSLVQVSARGGHVQVTGSFTLATAIGGVTLFAGGGTDGVAASLTFDGDLEWVRPVSGAGAGAVVDVATAPNGDAIVVGSCTGAAAVMPGPAQLDLAGAGASGFVAALDAAAD